MTPAEQILDAIAQGGGYDPEARRRVRPIPPGKLEDLLRHAWADLDREDDRWNSAVFVTGCGLLAYGEASVLTDVVKSLPPEPSPVRRGLLSALLLLVPFPRDARPDHAPEAALAWARRAHLAFRPSEGRYEVAGEG